jgi:hypothetical protein
MDAKLIKAISNQIYRRFPEVSGSRPKITARPDSQAKSMPNTATYLLTYRGTAKAPDGKLILRVVRVIVNEQGRILKMTTSK